MLACESKPLDGISNFNVWPTTPLPGAGVVLLLHHHGDQALLSSGSIKLQTGTDVEVSVVPQITVTTDEAVSKFRPEERGCYTCDEVMVAHKFYAIIWVFR
jgi:hypothetical protein